MPFSNTSTLERIPLKRAPGSLQERDGEVRTACQECSVSCGLVASTRGARIVDVQGDEEHPANRGALCARGTAFVQGLTSPERLVVPAARRKRGAALEPLDGWKAGLDLLAERLRQLRERHGADALLVACDRDGGLDFDLGARRFAALWGTSQVFDASGEPLDPWPHGLEGPTAPSAEWVDAGAILIVGADLAATHPVAFRGVQEARRRGAPVVAVDARFSATLAHADVAILMSPGRGNLLGLALAKLLVAQRAPEDVALANAAAWRASLEAMSLDGAEAALGAPLEALGRVAGLLAKHAPVTVITGRDLAALPHHRVWLALAAAMGWMGRPGGGWYPLDAGAPPLVVEGDPDAAPPAAVRGRPTLAEVVQRSEVQAVVCSGDALAPGRSPLAGAADAAELVAHFGAFQNATSDRASFTFPAALWAERDGVSFGGDRTIEWGRRIVDPPAGCRSGLDFWLELARRFGWEKQFPWAADDGSADHGAFWAWLLARSPATAGVRLEDVRREGRGRWAPPAEAAVALEAPLAPPSLAADAAASRAGYPLVVAAARSACRSGDASRHWPWTQGLAREDAVQIHPDTARRLGIVNGEEVVVETPRGGWSARASLTRAVPASTIAVLDALAGVPALVRKKDQSVDDARAQLGGAQP